MKLHSKADCVRRLTDAKPKSSLRGKMNTENHSYRICRVADIHALTFFKTMTNKYLQNGLN